MFLKYAMMREVSSPDRHNPTDAGIDFFMPKMTPEFISYYNTLAKNNKTRITNLPDGIMKLYIPPGASALIPSGIKVEIPYGFMGLFCNKSGVASKLSLMIGAQVIDTFYSGEVHIDLHNVGTEIVELAEDAKLAQMTLVPALNVDLTLVEEEDLYDWMHQNQTRGERGFGSSNEKANTQ